MKYSNEVSILLASVTLVLANMHTNEMQSVVTYAPKKGWINDPNGLVRVDGTYHLFYQYSPNSAQPEDMCWGHAVSSDLVDWQDEGVALAYNPATLEQRFSGSAVYDRRNASGLGASDGPVVAMYTSYYAENSNFPDGSPVAKGTQCQSLAFSQDKGKTWQTYHANPILKYPPPQYADQFRNFRDPKLFWYEPEHKWVMIVALSLLNKALFYSSKNLKQWTLMSEFSSKSAPLGSMWECPDLFKVKVENRDEKKWILSLSFLPPGADGFKGMHYFVGHFDGSKFVEDRSETSFKLLDHGSDFYAGVTWNNVGSRRLMIGWVNNWAYATKITDKYRGGLSMVRELSLLKVGGDYKLIQKPVKKLEDYVKFSRNCTKAEAENGIEMNTANSYRFAVNLLLGVDETSFSLVLENERRVQEAKIYYDRRSKIISIEKLNMDPSSQVKLVTHSAKFDAGFEIELDLFVDNNTLTLFCNNGELVFTELLISESKIRMLRLPKGSTAEVRAFTQFLLAKM